MFSNERRLDKPGTSIADDAEIAAAATGATPIPGGFAVSFPTDAGHAITLAEFISLERMCCGFLDLAVKAPAHSDTLELHLSGGPGAQEFLAAQLGV